MVRISSIEASDRDEWLPLWKGYLDFYESAIDDGTTESTLARIVDENGELHGAIARDDERAARDENIDGIGNVERRVVRVGFRTDAVQIRREHQPFETGDARQRDHRGQQKRGFSDRHRRGNLGGTG